MPSLLIGSKTTGALSWRRWIELKLVSQSLATLYSIPPPFFSPHFGMAAAACAGGSHRRNCMHLFLACRGSAEAEALERHTVFSTRVRAEALEQQKAEALKQQEAEALEGRGLRRQPVEASRLKLQPDPKRVLSRRPSMRSSALIKMTNSRCIRLR